MNDFFSGLGWILFSIFAFAICFVVGAGVIDIFSGDFHIYNYLDMSEDKQYRDNDVFFISDRDEFKGSYAVYSEPEKEVMFTIFNVSKVPYDFQEATYGVADTDGAMYQLKQAQASSYDFGIGNYILNPKDSLFITCKLPNGIGLNRVKGFRVWKNKARDNVNMRFGYLPEPFWKEFYKKWIKPRIK